jgi:hypothetical protein
MSIALSRFLALPILIFALALAGCSTNKLIVSEWSNPDYATVSFGRIMVGGLGGQSSIGRNFEDEFAGQLRAAGIDALPSYRYTSENEKVDEAKLKEAARQAGTDALIVARSVSVEPKTDVGPSYYPVPVFGIFGSHVGATWSGPYGGPSVSRYNVYTSEVKLYDISKNEMVWSGTVKTTQPEETSGVVKNYVEAVVKALNEKNLLGARK